MMIFYNLNLCVCVNVDIVLAILLARLNEETLHQHLIGVDGDLYASIRTNLLSRDPMASLDEAYLAFVQ